MNTKKSKMAESGKRCSMSLMLLLDESGSINDENWQHQVHGTADALQRPDIVKMLERQGGVAVAARSFGSDSMERIPWTVLREQKDADAFAAKLRTIQQRKGGTNIGAAINDALDDFDKTPCLRHASIIDISTDADNAGSLPQITMSRYNAALELRYARMAAEKQGVTVNGIGVNGTSQRGQAVQEMLERDVITENGFAMGTQWSDYREAIYKKLSRELLSEVTPPSVPQAKPGKPATSYKR